jgi:hypothetical protein
MGAHPYEEGGLGLRPTTPGPDRAHRARLQPGEMKPVSFRCEGSEWFARAGLWVGCTETCARSLDKLGMTTGGGRSAACGPFGSRVCYWETMLWLTQLSCCDIGMAMDVLHLLAPARLARMGRRWRCVSPLPAARLTPLTPVRVALRVPKQHGLVSRLPLPLGVEIGDGQTRCGGLGEAALPKAQSTAAERRRYKGGHGSPPLRGGIAAKGGGTQKSVFCETNPILCRPAWKSWGNEAKNEAKLEGWDGGSALIKRGYSRTAVVVL